jgi:hypothetical protein
MPAKIPHPPQFSKRFLPPVEKLLQRCPIFCASKVEEAPTTRVTPGSEFCRIRSTGQKTYNHCATEVLRYCLCGECATALSALESRQFSVQNQSLIYRQNSVQNAGKSHRKARVSQAGGPKIWSSDLQIPYPLCAIHNASPRANSSKDG